MLTPLVTVTTTCRSPEQHFGRLHGIRDLSPRETSRRSRSPRGIADDGVIGELFSASRPQLRRPHRQPGSDAAPTATDAAKDEDRERDDDQYDENGPQHCETPSLACLKRRNPGSRGGFASRPRRRCHEALPRESHRHQLLSRQASRRRGPTAGAAAPTPLQRRTSAHRLIRAPVRGTSHGNDAGRVAGVRAGIPYDPSEEHCRYGASYGAVFGVVLGFSSQGRQGRAHQRAGHPLGGPPPAGSGR